MKTKQVLQSLLFVLFAATSTIALSQARDDGSTVRDSGVYPWTPVGNPFIE